MRYIYIKHAPQTHNQLWMLLPEFFKQRYTKVKVLPFISKVNPGFALDQSCTCTTCVTSGNVLNNSWISFEILTRIILHRTVSGIKQNSILIGTIVWSRVQCQAGCTIISSFEVTVKVILFMKYVSIAAEKLISHWIPICFHTFSSHLAVSWGHVINSCLTSRPKHLKASTWPSSSLAWTNVPNGRAIRHKQHRSESAHGRPT